MTRIAVIDHGAGNLVSITQGLAAVGAEPVVVAEPSALTSTDGIVLPGVGSAAVAFRNLESAGFVEVLRSATVPLLGICVGLQLLYEGSDEDDAGGLGLLPGRVSLLRDAPRLPHIGWNDLDVLRPDPILEGIPPQQTFYFVHSYAAGVDDPGTVVATCAHGAPFAAVGRRGGAVGVQFHPERSGPGGLRVLANFAAACGEAADAA